MNVARIKVMNKKAAQEARGFYLDVKQNILQKKAAQVERLSNARPRNDPALVI